MLVQFQILSQSGYVKFSLTLLLCQKTNRKSFWKKVILGLCFIIVHMLHF